MNSYSPYVRTPHSSSIYRPLLWSSRIWLYTAAAANWSLFLHSSPPLSMTYTSKNLPFNLSDYKHGRASLSELWEVIAPNPLPTANIMSCLSSAQRNPNLSSLPDFPGDSLFQMPEFRVKTAIIVFLMFSFGLPVKVCWAEHKYDRIWAAEGRGTELWLLKVQNCSCRW